MIKIADKLWSVKGVDRSENLAYMCQVTSTKSGEPDASTKKMQTTGRNWASVPERWDYVRENGQAVKDAEGNYQRIKISDAREGEEAYHDNVPTTGFYIGSSVSRWSTENKVFNVVDPRGFMVQVPTGNIETLLHTCTVVKGVVQEECVWGREGNAHILLPIHSEEYIAARGYITKVEQALKATDLKPGDRVTLQSYGEEGNVKVFLGMVKLEWNRKAELITYKRGGSSWAYSYGYTEKSAVEDLGNETVKDDKWLAVFASQRTTYKSRYDEQGRYTGVYDEVKYTGIDLELNPKVLTREAGDIPEGYQLTPEFLMGQVGLQRQSCPDRVAKKFTHQEDDNYRNRDKEKRVSVKDTIVSIYAVK